MGGGYAKVLYDSAKQSLTRVIWVGPLANLYTAWLSVSWIMWLYAKYYTPGFQIDPCELERKVEFWLYFADVNVSFFILNLLPIWPLDGGRIMYYRLALPAYSRAKLQEAEQKALRIHFLASVAAVGIGLWLWGWTLGTGLLLMGLLGLGMLWAIRMGHLSLAEMAHIKVKGEGEGQ